MNRPCTFQLGSFQRIGYVRYNKYDEIACFNLAVQVHYSDKYLSFFTIQHTVSRTTLTRIFLTLLLLSLILTKLLPKTSFCFVVVCVCVRVCGGVEIGVDFKKW